MRKILFVLAGLVLLGVATFAIGLANARRDPIVRVGQLGLHDWPAGAAPVRVLLMSDLHIGNRSMDAARLQRIMRQARALKPDLIVLAGDFIAGHDAATARANAPALAAALSELSAPLGVIAVLGNHDYNTDLVIVRQALRAANIHVLVNTAVRAGPLVIGGISDKPTAHDDALATVKAMRRLRGGNLFLTHSPDTVYSIRSVPALRGDATPMLAGHTHCGQIALPGVGPIKSIFDSRVPDLCGALRLEGHPLFVTAGLGTSILPLRFGAPPDLWMVTIGPATAPGR